MMCIIKHQETNDMSKRLNIVLPDSTVQAIDRLTKPGQRSRFINDAVQHYVTECSTEALRTRLAQAVVRDQDLDREVATDWFAVDQEAWQRLAARRSTKRISRSAAKSSSRRSTRP
jgi:CopG family transcriptional regulator/antitoxin EndoAI